MDKSSKIYIAGCNGMVGNAIFRALQAENFQNLIGTDRDDFDLTDQISTNRFFEQEKPEFVFLAAARVGGIGANDRFRAEFIYQNIMIQSNVIHAAWKNGVKKLLFLGSSCIYPKLAPQPLKEEHLLSGFLEPTNEPYAIAKISGIKMCQSYNAQYGTNFISVMPTNLYGPNDNFDFENSHVLPAMIGKFHKAKIENEPTVTLWGSGKPMREFLYVEDLAEACVFLMQNYDDSKIINIGTGQDVTIAELARIIQKTVGFEGEIIWDSSKPDGTPRKLLDVSRINNLGWKAKTSLEDGIKKSYNWFLQNQKGRLR